MAAPLNFRTAFNGFNREDVVRYIEYLNAQHTAELNQLNSELEFLRGKLSQQAPVQVVEAPQPDEANPVIEQQAGRIRELFDQNKALEAQLDEAIRIGTETETELNAALAEKEQLSAQLAAALHQQNSLQSRADAELEAYRRAERMERVAKERAEQMYRQANGVLADATVKVDNAAAQISQLSDAVIAQLEQLQSAVTGSKYALRDAAATMYTIRPESEQN